MRYLLYSLLLLSSLQGKAQKNVPDQQQFHDLLLHSFNEIFSDSKIEKIDQYYANGFLILEDGVIWNRDSVVHALTIRNEREKKFTRKNFIDVRAVEKNGNTAWCSYYNDALILINDLEIKIRWLESAVFVREKNQWKIKLLHSTLVSRE